MFKFENVADIDDEKEAIIPEKRKGSRRNLICFWILGLCNNYGYVIMLSAAFDLLHDDFQDGDGIAKAMKNGAGSNDTICNELSTGAILLADILPSLIVKLIAPFLHIQSNIKVGVAILLSITSLIVTSLSVNQTMTFIGVMTCSLSSGLGEVTILAYSSYFEKNVVSAWSSGTGGAGVAGALSYAALRMVLSPRHTLQVILVVPVVMAITFYCIIEHPEELPPLRMVCECLCPPKKETEISESDFAPPNAKPNRTYTCWRKLSLIKPLLKYMIPLFLVFFAEYFINQGLLELLYFRNAKSWLDHKEQYRWLQVTYQVGVLISRSSVNLIRIKHIWVLPILQMINIVVVLLQVYFSYIPYIWIIFVIVLYEGLIGGAAYVNVFYRISSEVSGEDKEYSMGIASVSDTIGIAVAGAAAMPTHKALCQLPQFSIPP